MRGKQSRDDVAFKFYASTYKRAGKFDALMQIVYGGGVCLGLGKYLPFDQVSKRVFEAITTSTAWMIEVLSLYFFP